MSEGPTISEEYKYKLAEWLDLKATLKQVSVDMTELKKREKELKLFISSYMAANEFDRCNCKNGSTVRLKKTKSKGTINEGVIRRGLETYFDGNAEHADNCWNSIIAQRQGKESQTLTLTLPK